MDNERRKKDREDHDVLTRIDANLSNFMRRFDDHVTDDKTHLDRLYTRTGRIEKVVWMGMGALALFELAIRIFK